MFIEDPMMVPKIMAANISQFKLKAFVSKEIEYDDELAVEAVDYLDTSLSTGSFK